MRSTLLSLLATMTTVAAQYGMGGMGGYGMGGYGGYGGYGGMGGMYSPYTMGMMGGYGGNGGMMGGYGGGMYGGGMNMMGGGMNGMSGMMPGLAYSIDQYGGNVLNAGAQQQPTSNYGLGYGSGTVNGGSAYGLKNTYSRRLGAQGVSTSKTTNPLTLNPLVNLLNPANNLLNQPNVLNPLGLSQTNLLNPMNQIGMFGQTPMMGYMGPWAAKAKAKQ
ncbi:hypothetical protein PRIPAC_91881 [Pristionchus pacificus]|uniref:Uncharacterized protein n=1 Tax=Pristionchus pacificus TaxID=54126 RepID=A0A2A6BAY0_PRIPA|nr:hypothetical protein PRIPAC_91881 [Pristionchus pacificus]|eukprot:PDM63027.1 hypothetical protein PRIPAC_50242 [Pristionchus pacificus]